tara:strand:+ start:270 stop:431 length:162 start_codon:yes stop_codon:yes gene_type:complete
LLDLTKKKGNEMKDFLVILGIIILIAFMFPKITAFIFGTIFGLILMLTQGFGI